MILLRSFSKTIFYKKKLQPPKDLLPLRESGSILSPPPLYFSGGGGIFSLVFVRAYSSASPSPVYTEEGDVRNFY